jgi:hypothetical protein
MDGKMRDTSILRIKKISEAAPSRTTRLFDFLVGRVGIAPGQDGTLEIFVELCGRTKQTRAAQREEGEELAEVVLHGCPREKQAHIAGSQLRYSLGYLAVAVFQLVGLTYNKS